MDLFGNAPLPPLRPWEYVRLRRLAAGKTIEQAARPHCHRPDQNATVEGVLASLEQPGVFLHRDYLVKEITRSFPFDPEVYQALRDLPPEQHPTVCRGCGCTPWEPSTNRDGSEGTILPHGTCTACDEKAERAALRKAA